MTKVTKKLLYSILAILLLPVMATPVGAYTSLNSFDDYGGYTETTLLYTFLKDQSAVIYNNIVDFDFNYLDSMYAGSTLYIPIGVYDTEAEEPEDLIANEKQVNNDNVQVSYKVLQGFDYVEDVSLVSTKKEKIKDLPAGMYARVQYTPNYLPLNKTKVSVRLVLSVNNVSYQDTAITFTCRLTNREEYINRNSIYGALSPAQFRVSSRYRGEASFDFGGGVKYTGQVATGKRYYLNLDRAVDDTALDTYPGAYLEFYNFRGNNDTFENNGKLVIPVDKQKFKEQKTKAEVYAYEVAGDQLKALTKDDIRYDSASNQLVLRTRTLGSYILSSRALMKEIVDSGEEDILRSGYAASLDEPTGSGG